MNMEPNNDNIANTDLPDKLENNAYDSEDLYTQDGNNDIKDENNGDDTGKEDVDPKDEGTEGNATNKDIDNANPPQTQEELARKLKEYELKEQEQAALKRRLGLDDSYDNDEANLINLEQAIINRGKRQYLDLCTKYGVDADPETIEQTVQNLKATDPAKGFQLERDIENLSYRVNAQKNEVVNYQYQNSLNKFYNENSELLQASPELSNVLGIVAQQNYGNPNVYEELNGTLNYLSRIYSEAFAYGQKYSSMEKARKDTSGVEGSITNDVNQITRSDKTYTREQIANMSQEEFEKDYDNIMRLYYTGKIG